MTELNNGGVPQPRSVVAVAQNQKAWQWVNNEDFYKLLPSNYRSYYQNWVKLWLQWYDGYVPWIHGGSNPILSTNLATTIVNRSADIIMGGNLMFANARKPTEYVTRKGKPIGKALDFIANKWSLDVDFQMKVKIWIRNALAGGFSAIKLNYCDGELWVDKLRADRFYANISDRGEVRKCISVLSFYDTIAEKDTHKSYSLVEERRYEQVDWQGDEIPVIEYKMFSTATPIQYFTTSDNYIPWEQLPKEVRKAFKSEYSFMLNKPQAMNGFIDLGVYIGNGSDESSSVPQLHLGESILNSVLNYLYEYDFYNTCFNTDMYLARGRVMIPKYMQGARTRKDGVAETTVLEDFAYQKYDAPNPDSQKPEAIQFELRSNDWKEARNTLLENISTNIGLSPSTLASYLQDGSNRTAREVSAEESSTTLFVENARRRLEKPLNSLLKAVLRFYGYVDDVEIRWTRAGMTNQSVFVDVLTKAVNGGLISQKKAHDLFNFDDDEEQNAEDYELVKEEQASRQNSIFDGEF